MLISFKGALVWVCVHKYRNECFSTAFHNSNNTSTFTLQKCLTKHICTLLINIIVRKHTLLRVPMFDVCLFIVRIQHFCIPGNSSAGISARVTNCMEIHFSCSTQSNIYINYIYNYKYLYKKQHKFYLWMCK